MISKGIDEANAMIVLMSRASMVSPWVRVEVEIAVKRNLPLFPVLIEDCNVHSALQDIVYEDFRAAVDRPKQLDSLTAAIIRMGGVRSTFFRKQ